MHTLYPAIAPYKRHELAVGSPHRLYLEETGNPTGHPVMILHAGPGGFGDAWLRQFFDPQVYRIILFDQRGCGRSTPYAVINNNTTDDLLNDIHQIAIYLDLENFMLFGCGFGSMLALLYAQRYPSQITTLLLNQLFLGRKKDTAWFYNQGASLIYPDYWQDFISCIPESERSKIVQYYYGCLQGQNELARMSHAKNWALWQARCSGLQPQSSLVDEYSEPHFALAFATLASHFIINNYFIEENQILNQIDKIQHIPTYLIHGRYDMICPLVCAWELHKFLPSSTLKIIRDAGHSNREAGMVDALVTTSKEIAHQNLDVS